MFWVRLVLLFLTLNYMWMEAVYAIRKEQSPRWNVFYVSFAMVFLTGFIAAMGWLGPVSIVEVDYAISD